MSKRLNWQRAKRNPAGTKEAAPYAERKQEGDWYGRQAPSSKPLKLLRHGSGWAVFYPNQPLPLHDTTLLARHEDSGRQGLVRVVDIITQMHGGALLAVERTEQRQELHRPAPPGQGHRVQRHRAAREARAKPRQASIL